MNIPITTNIVGILSSENIHQLINNKDIRATESIHKDQIQPASLDVRLGDIAYRIRASFLPNSSQSVMEKMQDITYHSIDLTEGAVLEAGCIYLIPLMESLHLPKKISCSANPKSSTGRIDVFTRLLTDYGTQFNAITAGYKGSLYLEVSPRTFSIFVKPQSRLAQIRFRIGESKNTDKDIKELHKKNPLIRGYNPNINNGLAISIDLEGHQDTNIIGYRAKHNAGLIFVDEVGQLNWKQYWEPLYRDTPTYLTLDPDEFYILSSRESIIIPPTHAAEMIPFNPLIGEIRVHYAGFFDPGFGYGQNNENDSRAVLEVRSRDVPFILEHGQIVGRLIYENLIQQPNILYGKERYSHYQGQRLRLSKHFQIS